jgi:hypothetical protein
VGFISILLKVEGAVSTVGVTVSDGPGRCDITTDSHPDGVHVVEL